MRLAHTVSVDEQRELMGLREHELKLASDRLCTDDRVQRSKFTTGSQIRHSDTNVSVYVRSQKITYVGKVEVELPESIPNDDQVLKQERTVSHRQLIREDKRAFGDLRAAHLSDKDRLRRQSHEREAIWNDKLVVVLLWFYLTNRRAKPIKNRMVDDHD